MSHNVYSLCNNYIIRYAVIPVAYSGKATEYEAKAIASKAKAEATCISPRPGQG